MGLRYRVDHLITMKDEATVVDRGVVDIAAGRVVWSGPETEAPPNDGPEEKLSGLLIPGLVNTHSHNAMVLFRGAGEGLPVDRWLTELIWPREGFLTPEDVWWGMTLGAAELLANGVTTTHDMYFFPESGAEAGANAGLRTIVTPPLLTGENLTRFGTWEEQLDQMASLADTYRNHDLVTVGLGPHSAYAVPEEPLRAVAELARNKSLHIHLHVAEAEHEGDTIQERTGMTVPRYLEAIGILDSRTVAAHGVWLTSDDIALFSEHEVGVTHSPMSNGKHASGMAPVIELRSSGVPVGIATDGPSSHDRLDLFEEMRAAIRYARLRTGRADAMAATDALTMATREAGRVLGRDDLGHLGEGARADMVLIDTATLGPIVEPDDLITHLVYSGSPDLVESVWVEGRQVVNSGIPTLVDVEKARREVADRARRLAESI
ncbi:MAG: amidohydrolase family protein [Acidimicrobiia bacterium]|nr:amidohydrolase family protein [Acidimicrobiia bacterium]